MGLVSRRRQPSHGPRTSPSTSFCPKKFSRFMSAKILDSNPIHWLVVQPILHQLMEQADGTMLAWNCDQRSVFERYSISGQFCPMAGQFCPTGNILILLRFLVFTKIAGQFCPIAKSMPKSHEKFFVPNPQWFQQVTKFLFWRRFWHRPCITYRRTWTKPPIYRRLGWLPVINHVQCSMRHKLTYVSIRLGICGNGSHGDVNQKQANNPMPWPWYRKNSYLP